MSYIVNKFLKKNKNIIILILLIIGYFIFFLFIKKKVWDGFTIGDDNYNECNDILIPLVNIQTSTKYTAIIIEPRKHNALPFVLKNFTENLGDEWNFIIYYGNKNKDYINNIIKEFPLSTQKRITIIPLNIDNLSVAQYSTLFYCPAFYNNIPTDTFLIFQTDSIILKENKHKIYDFIDYDYVGAPWSSKIGHLSKMGVGNGGLSLRKKKKMQELLSYKQNVIQNDKYGKYIAEDQFFNGYYTPQVQVWKPSVTQAMNFSVETMFNETPFGVHKCWNWLAPDELIYMINKYPDIKKLAGLQN